MPVEVCTDRGAATCRRGVGTRMHWRAGAHPLVDRVDRLGRIERRVEVETAMSFLSGWSATLTLPDYGRFARDQLCDGRSRKYRWHAQVKRDLKLDVDGPL